MYLIMVLKRVRTISLLAGLLCAVPAPGLEQSLELGRDQLWRDMGAYDGVVSVPGRWGLQDLTLAQGAYQPDADTELLLHFDRASEGDATGAWRFTDPGSGPLVAEAAAAIGAGGAAFQSPGDGVALTGPTGSLFSPGSVWGDFTIEFWLHPATLANGETVLSWEGGVREGGGVASQALRAVIRDRRLVWEARDLFTLPGRAPALLHADGHPPAPAPGLAPSPAALRLPARRCSSTRWTARSRPSSTPPTRGARRDRWPCR